MTEQEWLNKALASMHTGQWFGFSNKEQNYSTLIIHDSSITKPTKEKIEAKIQELKDEEANAIIKKEEAKAKLIELGLTTEHLKTLGL